MIGVVAPEVPAAGLFVIGLVAAVTALFLVLLRFSAVTLIGGLLRWLAHLVSWVPFVGGLTEDGINAGINAVDEALGAAVAASTGLASSMIHDAWKLTVWVGDTIADLATSTAHAVTAIVTSTIPNAVHSITHPITLSIGAIETRVLSIERAALKDLRGKINAARAAAAGALVLVTTRIHAAEHAITTTIPADLAGIETDIRGWTSKQLRRLTRRMSAVEEAIGLTALTGLIVAVIARQLPWIRCPNVGRAARQLCGMPVTQVEKLLADLALGATLIFGTLSLSQFAKQMQGIVGEAASEVSHFWRADVTSIRSDRQPGQTGL